MRHHSSLYILSLLTMLIPYHSAATETPGDQTDEHSFFFQAMAKCSQRENIESTIEGCTYLIRSTFLNTELMAKAYNNRGNAYDVKGQVDNSISDYSKAIEANPHYANAYFNRGHAYARKNLYELAISDYDKTIALRPDLAVAYNNRGELYDRTEKFDMAVINYSKAIEINGELIIAYLNRGRLFEKLGHRRQAIGDFMKVWKLDNKNKIAKNYLKKLGVKLFSQK